MEDLLNDVAEIRFAAERAGEKVANLERVDEKINPLLAFIANLAGNIEEYLENFEGDKSTELEIGFLMNEGIDPWSLFGEKPE